MKKRIKLKYKKNNFIFSIGSKGFTLIELIATIAIISIISTITIFSISSLISSSKEKSLQTTYSSLKETGVALSKELSTEYWNIDKLDDDNYIYTSCISVKDMKNNGYYKNDDFKNVDNINDDTFVVVKKDYDSKTIISSEVDFDEYCSKSFNTANLKVKSYTHSTISVSADCGSGEYKYSYYVGDKYVGDDSKNYTYTGLNEDTSYKLRVTCSKEGDSVSKTGNVEQTTGIRNNIIFTDTCTSNPIDIIIKFNKGDNFFFKLTSSGSIDSKYNAIECYELDANSCSSDVSTYVKANTWYKVDSKNIVVSINNNGSIYAYSGSDGDIKYSSSLTNTVTMIDKSIPNIPNLIVSDNITSGNWHNKDFTITLSGGESNSVNSKCKGVTYQISSDNSNFTNISGTSKVFNTEEDKTYYFRSKGKNGNYSKSVSYNSKNDQHGPSCSFSSISNIEKTHTTSVTLNCTDKLSGVVSKKLSSNNFELKNVSITSISNPISITNGYKYTIGIKATSIGKDSYISLNPGSILDNAGNGNLVSKSNTFQVLPNTYTIKFNNNGGSATMSDMTMTYGTASNLTSNSFKKQYTVTYNYGGATGGNSKGTAISSYKFVGWTMGGPNLYSKLNLDNNSFSIDDNGMLYINKNNTTTSTQYVNFFFKTRNDIVSGNDYTEIAVIKSLTYSGNMNYYVGDTPNASGTITQVSAGVKSVSDLIVGNNYFSLTGTSITNPIYLSRGFIGIPAGASLNIKFRPVLIASKYNNIDMYYYDKGSVNISTPVDKNTVTLYADWNEMPVTLPTPTKTGYTFKGWYTSASGGTKVGDGGSSYIPTSNITLYARWDANYYSFDLNGYLDGGSSGNISGYGTADVYINGSLVCDDCSDYYQQHPYGSSYEIKDIKSTTGHTYNGVYSGNLSGTITGNTATSLKFSTNTYTLTYDNKGGDGCSNKSIKYGNEIGDLCTPTRDGYTFLGWTTVDGNVKYKISSETKVSGDIKVYAIWVTNSINSYRCDTTGKFYFITYCYMNNSTAYCHYTEENGFRKEGDIARSELRDSHDNKSCTPSYTSATINNGWWVFRQPGYIVDYDRCGGRVWSFHSGSCYTGVVSEVVVATASNYAPVLLRTDLEGHVMGEKTINGKDFYLIFILDKYINKTGHYGCAYYGMSTCNDLETINYNDNTYYGVWISVICETDDGKTCPADKISIKFQE